MGQVHYQIKKKNKPLFIASISIALLFFLTASVIAEVNRFVGQKPIGYGSELQAHLLLGFLDANQAETRFVIGYATEIDIVTLVLDLKTDSLVRIHKNPDGSGTSETWVGDVMHRLESAKTGGSLNDSSTGKSFALYQKF